jgi:hypothetical protein
MKKEKPGVVIYYKHLKILEEAGLSFEQIGRVLSAAIQYDETGELPQFDSPLSAFFTMIRYDVDANRKRWDNVGLARSEAGRKGGRPKKTNGFVEGKKNYLLFEDQDSGEETGDPADQLFADIKAEAKTNGFIIDEPTAYSFMDCGIDPAWLYGPHSFLELAAERVTIGRYRDKPPDEQKSLFRSAVLSWEELRDEYPEWKKRKEERDTANAYDDAKKAALENYPRQCRCGGGLNQVYGGSYWCESCGASFALNTESLEWEYTDSHEALPKGSLKEGFHNLIGRKQKEAL